MDLIINVFQCICGYGDCFGYPGGASYLSKEAIAGISFPILFTGNCKNSIQGNHITMAACIFLLSQVQKISLSIFEKIQKTDFKKWIFSYQEIEIFWSWI